MGRSAYSDSGAGNLGTPVLRKQSESRGRMLLRSGDARRLGCGVSGILAPGVGLSSVYMAATHYGNFSWRHQAISDLFHSNVTNILTPGTIAAGLLMTGLSFGISMEFPKSRALKVSSILLGIAGASLALTGMAQGELHFLHKPAIATYFVATSASLISSGIGLLKKNYAKWVGYAAVASGVAELGILSTRIYPGIAIKEAAASGLIGLWLTLAGTKLVMNGISDKIDNAGMLRVAE
jgi:hypothetical membrane protein